MNPDLSATPSVKRLLDVQLQVWPEHLKFLTTRFAASDLPAAERVAGLILKLADDPKVLATDYRWLCERLYEEELHLRRTGSYRLSRFEDAVREVYANREFMSRYMNGLLISQLWWENHTRVMDYYAGEFLGSSREGSAHLEIGPGHGLLLYMAAMSGRAGTITGWDLSDASLDATREALTRLATPREVRLVKRDLFDAPDAERFDTIVLSEVCEHLEYPQAALRGIRRHLAPGGRLFVNVPVNSPAPDHIYLLRTPEEAVEMVRSSGYDILDQKFFPMTGHSEAKARKNQLTISCVVVGTAAA
jgi:2-polyprenyl-3-methyl-5-hydroxy-6-metoxy-1,4-benzoquinol methylase